MPSPYIVRPLTTAQVAQAFPLLAVLDPGLTLERWSDYATAFVEPSEDAEPRRIMTAQNAQGYIYGLASCRRRCDLHHGCVLEVENFVSLDLTGNKVAANALLTVIEALAREWGCGHISLSLLDPRMRSNLSAPRQPATSLFDFAGYHEEPFRLGKELHRH